MIKISVVIPVYNAETYVLKAAESAIQQAEVSEVLLIEDGSYDNSLQICVYLENKYAEIRVLRHPDGAGASRNLGIKNAKFEYIAFLDADDFYLPKRFTVPIMLFKMNPNIDGVYEAVGVHFYNNLFWNIDGKIVLSRTQHSY